MIPLHSAMMAVLELWKLMGGVVHAGHDEDRGREAHGPASP